MKIEILYLHNRNDDNHLLPRKLNITLTTTPLLRYSFSSISICLYIHYNIDLHLQNCPPISSFNFAKKIDQIYHQTITISCYYDNNYRMLKIYHKITNITLLNESLFLRWLPFKVILLPKDPSNSKIRRLIISTYVLDYKIALKMF